MPAFSTGDAERGVREESVGTDAEACGTPHAPDVDALASVATQLLTPETIQGVADLFRLLADPTRVRLVDALSHGERCVCDLATLVGLSESAVSHQLRLLRAARLVRVRRTGRQAFYSLDDHHVLALVRDTRRHVEEAR
jgi:DNA-binding transcriptional ArsR family regulator